MADFAEARSRLGRASLERSFSTRAEAAASQAALRSPGQRREAGFPSLSGPLGRVEPPAAEGRTNFAEFPSPAGTRPHPSGPWDPPQSWVEACLYRLTHPSCRTQPAFSPLPPGPSPP